MSQRRVTLEDKYDLTKGRAFLTGIQALVRLPLDQARRDRADGLNTAGFISGYRGSPLGGYDQQLRRVQKRLDAHAIKLWEGLNEDLGATAVWGSQQVGLFPGARYDGVFGIWYGKAPGVDRTGDVFKHANFAGTAAKGGVIAVAGDDHACKSSTLPSQSEFAFIDFEMPTLNPASVQDVLDYGLYGLAMSRFSGLWVGLTALADTMDSAAVIEVGSERIAIRAPEDFILPPEGLGIRLRDEPLAKEKRLRELKLPAALAFARANRLDRVILESPAPRLGLVVTGQAARDVFEALDSIGLDEARAAAAGIAIYKVAMPWPLEGQGLRAFCRGLERVLVIEHKRALIEPQLRDLLYHAPADQRPAIEGKRDREGRPLFTEAAVLSIPEIARAIHDRLPEAHRTEEAQRYFARVERSAGAAKRLAADITRTPHYCAGCPHNTSTKPLEGSRVLAGIGCHYMATFMDRADMTSQMGGEGVGWIGQAPFTDEPHVFVNLGDGTYSHSGVLAIRAALTAGVNITYKLLYNNAVAMTGGQDVETGFTPLQIIAQLRAEGVAKIAVVADDLKRYQGLDVGPDVDVYDRTHLDEVQDRLRATPGVTVLLYDQTCATERRRRVKRGLEPAPKRRAFINPAVCEGCGDCSVQSNCLAVEPLDTEYGVKRRVNQSACNQDLSCVRGFCPSFATLEGAPAAKAKAAAAIDASDLPAPALPALDRPWTLVLTGIGGTGITTLSAILGMAAHIDGSAAATLDMAGLAQKGGPVISHIRFARTPEAIRTGRTPAAGADALIAGDLVVSGSKDCLPLLDAQRTRAVACEDVAPTSGIITNRTLRFEPSVFRRRLGEACAALDALAAERLAEERFGDALYSNMIMLGFGWAKGLVPVSLIGLRAAIELNGVAVKQNLAAFDLGRVAALAPERLAARDAPKAFGLERDLDAVVADRAAMLAAYQDEAYAQRYRDLVEAARARESALGLGDRFSKAVAFYFAKVMAYKDEYEVARLYTDGRWRAAMTEQFGPKLKGLKLHLAPPLLSGKDPVTGVPRKIAFGPWVLSAFGVLAGLKGLRKTGLDPFGATAERRAERRLRDEYERKMRRLIAELSPATHALAVAIASIPDEIRGFGHVKAEGMAAAEAREARLWAEYAALQAAPAADALEPVS